MRDQTELVRDGIVVEDTDNRAVARLTNAQAIR